MAGVSLTLNLAEFLRPGGVVDVAVERAAIRVESRAKVLCPVDTGRLRASIRRERGDAPLSWRVSADTAYARWIHEGERFDPRAGRTVHVRVGPRPFLVDALAAASGGGA